MNLKNKIAVLTGVSSGLGKSITQALIDKGVIVYGLARNSEALSLLRENLGQNFHPVRMDITNAESVKNWVEETFSLEKIPNILINNAGAGSFQKIEETEEEEWLKMINTNLNGMFYITKAVSALMKETQESSHILNIGSILGKTARPEGAAYCASKFGVSGFTESLFKELRFFNIKVTAFHPGSIETDFFKSSGIKAHKNMLSPKDLANTIIHILEMPENMLVNEITVRPLNPSKPKSNL